MAVKNIRALVTRNIGELVARNIGELVAIKKGADFLNQPLYILSYCVIIILKTTTLCILVIPNQNHLPIILICLQHNEYCHSKVLLFHNMQSLYHGY